MPAWPRLAGSDLALARALELAIHPAAGSIIVVAAIMILLSHQNLEYMAGPRILQALAVDGFASSRAQKIGKGGNPVFAILVTWLVSVGLILIGGFEFLLLLSVFFFVPLYLALIIGVLILRRREPDTDRPYRAWGHPYSTILCLVAWTIVTLFQAYVERETAVCAVVLRQHPGLFFRSFHVLAENTTSHLSGLPSLLITYRCDASLQSASAVWQLAPDHPATRVLVVSRPRRNIRRGNCSLVVARAVWCIAQSARRRGRLAAISGGISGMLIRFLS